MTNSILTREELFSMFDMNDDFNAASRYAIRREVTDDLYEYFITSDSLNVRINWAESDKQNFGAYRQYLQESLINSSNHAIAEYWMTAFAVNTENEETIKTIIDSDCINALVLLAFYNRTISVEDLVNLMSHESQRVKYAAFRNLKNNHYDEDLITYGILLGADIQPLYLQPIRANSWV